MSKSPNFFGFLFSRTFVIQLVLIVLVLAGMLYGTLVYLDYFTLHGEEITVPDLHGLDKTDLKDFLDEKDLNYTIMSGPTNGVIVLADNPDIPITTFTQEDVDEGRVQFIQDGGMESGAFYFSVSDGAFKPRFKVFNIRVHPLSLELVSTSGDFLI